MKSPTQQSPSMLILATRCFAVVTPKQHEERALGRRLRRGQQFCAVEIAANK